ncbi:MAG TPA: Crp/Fnr family transcriptional regulator [Chitinophagales bacterium]|nr:Crp/Fnr family transcriptional regulator [Chitinophagales bacterium]
MPNAQPVIDFISEYVKIDPTELEVMLTRIHFSSFGKNETIMRQGEIPKRLVFILKGAVRIFYTDEKGHEQMVGFSFENQPVVAFDSFANQTPAGIGFVTMEPTDVIWTSHDEFFGFLETYPKYETLVRSVMGQYLTIEGEHSRLLRLNPARDRYEALCKSRPELITRVPLKYIASYLGMTLETLSRVRAGKL